MVSGQNSKNNICRLCDSSTIYCFEKKVLLKYSVSYFICPRCKLLQTEHPYWLDEAYSINSDISYDTGYLYRNNYYSRLISKIIYYQFNKNSTYIDFGGGLGVFTRLMRDEGFDFYWEDEFSQNIFAKGFEIDSHPEIIASGYTALEVVEHLPDIKLLLDKVFKSNNSSFIIFTTKLYGNDIPNPDKWPYYSFEAGQHISLYNLETLHYLAKMYNLFLYTNEYNFHILSRKKLKNIILDILVKYKLFKYIPSFVKTRHINDSEAIKKILTKKQSDVI
jgi:hypothetical protein